MIRSIALAAAIVLAVPSAVAAPQRVMSLNLCTDQLLLQLLPSERISSVTYLSRLPEYSYLNTEALGVPINYGTSEEVLREHPDMVVAGTTTATAVRALLRRVGTPLVEVPAAESFDGIRDVTRTVARAVGAEEKAETLIAEMDTALSELARTAPERKLVVAGWNGVGNVSAKGTLFDAILTAAGGENVASRINIASFNGYTALDLELLIAIQPDVLAYGNSRINRLDLSLDLLKHRVVRRHFAGREITYPETLYSCGLPQSATVAARDLRQAMVDIVRRQASQR